MKNKFKKAILAAAAIVCFSTTTVLAASGTYRFSLMTGSVGYSGYVAKGNENAYAMAECTALNYPSAKLRYTILDDSYAQVGSNTFQGIGSFSITYSKAVHKNEKFSLVVENLSSNGGVTVSTAGNWTP